MRLRAAKVHDPSADPDETTNLVDTRPDVAAALAADLVSELRASGPGAGGAAGVP